MKKPTEAFIPMISHEVTCRFASYHDLCDSAVVFPPHHLLFEFAGFSFLFQQKSEKTHKCYQATDSSECYPYHA